MNTHSIGIDFGTYKTLVSHINHQTNIPETIRLGVGRDYIPTSAYIDSEGVISFGDEADDMLEDCTGRYLRGFKMKLGSSTPLHMYLENGQPRMLTAKELVKSYLQHIRQRVQQEVYHGEAVTAATITRPVNFSPAQCEELKQAALNAGFHTVNFATEPEAAGLAFCRQCSSNAFKHSALIVDWGGGTLDFALVTRHGNAIHTHSCLTGGDTTMGGEKFDEKLWIHAGNAINNKLNPITQLPKVRRAKEQLSSKDSTVLRLSYEGGTCPPLPIKRIDFEKLITDDINSAVHKIQALLSRIPAEHQPEMLLLVGGSSKIPLIKKKLEAACHLPALSWDKSREAVSLGAAYHVEDVRKKPMMQDCLNEQSLVTILRQGMNPNSTVECTTEEGETFTRPLIFIPIVNENIKCLEILLENGADINACGSDGQSALHCAVYEGNAKMVKFLLNHQANPNIQDNDGCTALHRTSTDKNEEIISTLLSHQADPNIQDNSGLTALHYAALESADKCIELLLKGGANPNIQDNYGCTALHYTCSEPEEDDEYTIDDCCRCVQLLIEHNCHLSTKDKDGDTPLLLALRENSHNTAKLLYEAGADTNIKNNNGECANDHLPDSWKQQKQIAKVDAKQSAIEELAKEYDIIDSYDKELISAAQKGATKRLILLISAGANINYTDSDKKCTALSLAVQNQRIETVKILLTQPNIDINKDLPLEKAVKNDAIECFNLLLETTTIDVNSAIHAAAQQKNPQFLYKLLNRNEANVNKKNDNGLTPLHLAAEKNNTDHVNRLLQHPSIDVNMETKNGNSALMLAISAGSTGAFGQLIKYKNLRINHRNNEGYTALHIAIKEKSPITFIQMLLNYKDVRVNDKTAIAGYTPLHWALKNDYTEAALLLLENPNININEQDNDGNSLLHIAALYNRDEIMGKMLKIKGIQVNITNKRGDTPLHLAVEKNNISAALHLLNYQGIDVNCVNSEKNTPLHIAVAQRNLDIIKNLTTHKNASAGINQRNIYGRTPLILAVTHNKKADFVQALLKVENIDVNRADNAGNTPLHLAAEQDQRFILELLLKACRIDVNARNNEGNTPLHIAAKKNFPQIVSALLNKKCFVNPRNNNKKTPFSYTTIGFGLRNPFNQCYDRLKEKGGRE